MPERRTKILILLLGLLISTATPLCYAQDPGTLFEVKKPQAEVSPAFVPEITNTAVPVPAQVKPDKKAPGRSWLWRLFEGTLLGAARYNTDKQGDGRPQPAANSR